jgi:N-acetyl-gamma-glutamyl-phosphate reductase
MVKVAVIGATGYTGQDLVRILSAHPAVELTMLTSRQNQGVIYGHLFPAFRNIVDLRLSELDYDQLAQKAEIAFLAFPHTESQPVAAELLERKVRIIDLSADFRFRKAGIYRRYYSEHRFPALLRKAVYGLPEIYREQIRKAQLVANPGCYPTSVILALKPLMERRLIDPKNIIIDSKSGLSGAGRSAVVDFLFCEISASVKPYNIFKHRHQPEMEQELTRLYGRKAEVIFVPHLVPINRGILSTIYVKFPRKTSPSRLEAIYHEAYSKEKFVRILSLGELPDTSKVKGSNFIDIGLSLSPDGKSAVISSALDNLVKGATGNAVQNMNIMFGLEEDTGLKQIPLHP